MGVFSVSDILVAATLLVNAAALISSLFPIPAIPNPTLVENVDEEIEDTRSIAMKKETEELNETTGYVAALKARVALLFRGVRGLSCLIAIWNMAFVFMLVLVFD